MSQKRKIVLDCDPGVDDAFALQFLLNSSSYVELIAILTGTGNCKAEQGARNACRLLHVNNRRDVPVYVGQSGPIIEQQTEETHKEYFHLMKRRLSSFAFHGSDGFGDTPDMSPTFDETDFTPLRSDMSAGLKLIQLANEHPNELDVIAIGPLTNLATAVKLDSKLPSKLRSLTIMGGNMNGIGNMHVVGEFNFYADPEAAKIVLDEYTPLVSQIKVK